MYIIISVHFIYSIHEFNQSIPRLKYTLTMSIHAIPITHTLAHTCTRTHTNTHTHARGCTLTHTCYPDHTYTRTHMHTHTHTHVKARESTLKLKSHHTIKQLINNCIASNIGPRGTWVLVGVGVCRLGDDGGVGADGSVGCIGVCSVLV